MNKILVEIYIPIIEEKYDVWLPKNKKIYNIIELLLKGIYELSKEEYYGDKYPTLYNKLTGKFYDLNAIIKDTDIKNGTQLILI